MIARTLSASLSDGQYVVAAKPTVQNAGMNDRLFDNWNRVNEEIECACKRSGRLVSAVKLVAVTKYARLEWINRLIELGVRDLGENRPQQLVERADQLPLHVEWHLIGHLQRNKVRPVLPKTALIHSVDSVKLLERIASIAVELDLLPRVLLEVNVSGEASKDGMAVEELRSQWDKFIEIPGVEIRGLMTMAPQSDDPATARLVFQSLRQLRDDLAARSPSHIQLPELSMGMSGDFHIAIEEGATIVRIGSRLFDGLES